MGLQRSPVRASRAEKDDKTAASSLHSPLRLPLKHNRCSWSRQMLGGRALVGYNKIQISASRNGEFRGAECYAISRQASAMARTETIRGLARGLQVLQALQATPISSLHDIHLRPTYPSRAYYVSSTRSNSSGRCRGAWPTVTTASAALPAPHASVTETTAWRKRQRRCSTVSARRYPGPPTYSCRPAITWSGGKPAVRRVLRQSPELHDPHRPTGELADDRSWDAPIWRSAQTGNGKTSCGGCVNRTSRRTGWHATPSKSTRCSPRREREAMGRARRVSPAASTAIRRTTDSPASPCHCSTALACMVRSTSFGSGPS